MVASIATGMAPCARSRAITAASASAIRSSVRREPQVTRVSATSMMSFTPKGMPSSGRARPARMRSALSRAIAPAASIGVRTASLPLGCAMRRAVSASSTATGSVIRHDRPPAGRRRQSRATDPRAATLEAAAAPWWVVPAPTRADHAPSIPVRASRANARAADRWRAAIRRHRAGQDRLANGFGGDCLLHRVTTVGSLRRRPSSSARRAKLMPSRQVELIHPLRRITQSKAPPC